MNYALITACVVALAGAAGLGAHGMDEGRAPLAAAPEESARDGQFDLQTFSAPWMSETATPAPSSQEAETTGLGSAGVARSPGAAVGTTARDEPRSAADVRHVRAAVERTLRRTHESVRT